MGHSLAIYRYDSSRLLPAMLQGIEAEVGQLGRIFETGNAEDSTHIRVSVRRVLVRDNVHTARNRIVVDAAQFSRSNFDGTVPENQLQFSQFLAHRPDCERFHTMSMRQGEKSVALTR